MILRDQGPGPAGRVLQSALARPHVVIPPAPGIVDLPVDMTYNSTVIILGRNARVASRVRGDVIVVGGDLFVRPGAQIEGRAVAIGGGAYPSFLADVRDGLTSFRDVTYGISPTARGWALDYRPLRGPPEPPFSLPGLTGIRIATYDRTNGVSLGMGPRWAPAGGVVEIEPRVVYRSQLGAFDPAVVGRWHLDRRSRVQLYAGRGTFSNDRWILTDLTNSLSALAFGIDARNYFRAERVEASVNRVFEGNGATIEPWIGARTERAWPARPDTGATGGPWSLYGRRSETRMLRPNPPAVPGNITGPLVGLNLGWETQGIRARALATTELALSAPNASRFAQTTVHGRIAFPTFGTQRLRLETHAVFTQGDTAPPQRWAHLGGTGTLPFHDLLELGGDQLLYFNSRYDIPFERIEVLLLGSPTLFLRQIMGSAGVGSLPPLDHVVGGGVAWSFVQVEWLIDPSSQRQRFTVTATLVR